MEDIFSGVGVEIALTTPEDFLKIRETLSRIGVSSRKEKILYQSCHILHKRGRYAILHFKELFALDGKPTDITENDLARRNAIAGLLAEWKLCVVLQPETLGPSAPLAQIKIISHKEKGEWQLITKYTMGRKSYEQQDNTQASPYKHPHTKNEHPTHLTGKVI